METTLLSTGIGLEIICFQGIAKVTGVKVADLAMLNVFYELSRFCTSIVAESPWGKLYHARNLDFGQPFIWDPEKHTWALTDALKRVRMSVFGCKIVPYTLGRTS